MTNRSFIKTAFIRVRKTWWIEFRGLKPSIIWKNSLPKSRLQARRTEFL